MFFLNRAEQDFRPKTALEKAIGNAELAVCEYNKCAAESLNKLLNCAVTAQKLKDNQSYELACDGIIQAQKSHLSARQWFEILSNIKSDLSADTSGKSAAEGASAWVESPQPSSDLRKMLSEVQVTPAEERVIREQVRAAVTELLRAENQIAGSIPTQQVTQLVFQEEEQRRSDAVLQRPDALDADPQGPEAPKKDADKLGRDKTGTRERSEPFQAEIIPASCRRMGREGASLFLAAMPQYRRIAIERWQNNGRYAHLVEGTLPKSEERSKVRAFMQARYAALGAKADMPQIAYSAFEQAQGGAVGQGVARYRWAGILSSLKPSERIAVMVHESSHAAGAVRLRYWDNPANSPWLGDLISTENSQGMVSSVREGWIHYTQEGSSPFPSSRFMVFEEFAACSHEAAWYRSQGWTEKVLPGVVCVRLSKEKQWQIVLARAARWLESADLGCADDERCQSPSGALVFAEELHGRTAMLPDNGALFVKGRKSFRIAYGQYRAAMHLLAPELYPGKALETALTSLEDDLCRVQAGIAAPGPFLRRVKAQLGSDAAWFFAHLQNDTGLFGRHSAGPCTVFLGLLADSCGRGGFGDANSKTPEQGKRARELLFQGLKLYIQSCRHEPE